MLFSGAVAVIKLTLDVVPAEADHVPTCPTLKYDTELNDTKLGADPNDTETVWLPVGGFISEKTCNPPSAVVLLLFTNPMVFIATPPQVIVVDALFGHAIATAIMQLPLMTCVWLAVAPDSVWVPAPTVSKLG
jgi:hypothetical protein